MIKYNIIILILLAILMSSTSYASYADDISIRSDEEKSIYASEVKKGTSEDLINLMKKYRRVFINKDTWDASPYIYDWPSKSDIPYLLSMVDNKDTCGILASVFSSYMPTRTETRRHCGVLALNLLKAIQVERFHHLPPGFYNPPPKIETTQDEKKQLIKWAKEEISK